MKSLRGGKSGLLTSKVITASRRNIRPSNKHMQSMTSKRRITLPSAAKEIA